MAEFYKLVVNSSLPGGVTAQNRYWLKGNDANSGADLADVLTDLQAYLQPIYANVANIQSSGVENGYTEVYLVNDIAPDEEFIGAFDLGSSGGVAGDMLPQQVSALATARVDGTKGTAKKYFAGISEAVQADGILDSSALTALATAIVQWLTTYVGATTSYTWVPVVVRIIDGVLTWNNISNIGEANDVLSTMRSRKIGVGI